ncbi:hypothetical protein IV203_003892 [Nitzschia inconspicua]|uniref:Uncharacterized protein n=1 Tax=Nitzschia inconspicua TaxID=303405 RepID=A0A9K3PPM5_9STRA|nr:hypothetical protein IV203_003892 [Nitzschia inconspicua]
MTLFIVEEEVAGYLPEEFSGLQKNAIWQERAIMLTWMLLLIGYILSLAPILFVSFFFWILAVEWSLDSALHFSMESFDHGDEEGEEHVEGEFCYLMDRLQSPIKPTPTQSRGILGVLLDSLGLLPFSSKPSTDNGIPEQRNESNDLDEPHVHHHDMPPLVNADWN